MAFTVRSRRSSVGDRKQVFGTITPDSSWTAAGESLTKAELKLEDELNALEIEDEGRVRLPVRQDQQPRPGVPAEGPCGGGRRGHRAGPVADSVDLSSSPGAIPFIAIGKGTAAA
jgi:hypothetical protein